MKRTLMTFLLCFALASVGHAQKLAVKMNGLGLGTFAGFGQWSPTPNLGVEVALWPKWTLDIDGYWNPFKYSENKFTKFWAVQPELRYWFCNKFNGHFIGLHGQYVDYERFGMRKYVYEGKFYGTGLSYGYALSLGHRWKLEGNIGFGWNNVQHDKKWFRLAPTYLGGEWDNFLDPADKRWKAYGPEYGNMVFVDENGHPVLDPLGDPAPTPIKKNYWGVTRAGISVIFVIR